MDPGYPLATPEPTNLTACKACEKAYTFGADLELQPLDLDAMAPDLRAIAERMWKLVRAIQGKAPETRRPK
jgi:hypothetical protein